MKTKPDPNFNKIKKVLEHVWNSPYSNFYKDFYKQAGVNLLKVKSMEDFFKLPYLTKNEMIKVGPYDRLFIPQNKIKTLIVTSGTTSGGNSPYVSFKAQNEPLIYKLQFIETKKLKIKRVMVMRKILGKSMVAYRDRGYMTIFGDMNNLLASAKVAAQIRVDGLQTTATILYFFIPYLKKEYDLKNIRYIRLGGEYASEKRMSYLKKQFPNAYFELTYGFSEAQRIGFRCKYLDKMSPRFFHPIPLYFYETINPEEESELVVTHLHTNSAFPLIRYKTGDSVRLETINCPCGQNQRIEVVGRIGFDLVKISGTAIYVDYVYKALEPFKKYLASPEWQLHLYEEEKGDQLLPKLKLQLITKETNKTNLKTLQNLLSTGIAANLYLSAKATLTELIDKGAFLPLEIEFVTEFPVSLKKKHIVSHLV